MLLVHRVESLGFMTEHDKFHFGYIIPGHGVKGKQQTVESSDDISEMYDQYRGRKEIIIWIKVISTHATSQRKQPGSKSRKYSTNMSAMDDDDDDDDDDITEPQIKRKKSSGDGGALSTVPKVRGSNYTNHLKKMSEVECIIDDLEKRHESGKYSAEQIRVWAHMIQMGKHDSYDNPPSKRFFKSSKPVAPETCTLEGISPSKRLNMRSELIAQLDKWHALMERGAISMDQYTELQATILKDIKRF